MKKLFSFSTLLAAGLFSASALASITITGTRVVYPADAKEVSVKINNVGKSPVLLQSWLDDGDPNAKPETIRVPFTLTPPINRVDPDKSQTLRIGYTGNSLPGDRESVFWLNVLEIPAKYKGPVDANYLQVAFRTRIKLFYRPASLAGDANEAAKQLTWKSLGKELRAENGSPYYVSLVEISANGKKVEGEMIAPFSSRNFKLSAASGAQLKGEFVNDYGAINSFTATVK
jgi:chaperone protein EcpD